MKTTQGDQGRLVLEVVCPICGGDLGVRNSSLSVSVESRAIVKCSSCYYQGLLVSQLVRIGTPGNEFTSTLPARLKARRDKYARDVAAGKPIKSHKKKRSDIGVAKPAKADEAIAKMTAPPPDTRAARYHRTKQTADEYRLSQAAEE